MSKLKKLKKSDTLNNNNLSYFLNILDGLQECSGRIIIMTTNKPHILDNALIREGRIDYKIEFTNATYEDVKNIVHFYWSDTINKTTDNELCSLSLNVPEIVATVDKKYTHAKIINICRSSDTIETAIRIINS
jgi:ATP-dependent 26S proteasome regulatory subunit